MLYAVHSLYTSLPYLLLLLEDTSFLPNGDIIPRLLTLLKLYFYTFYCNTVHLWLLLLFSNQRILM